MLNPTFDEREAQEVSLFMKGKNRKYFLQILEDQFLMKCLTSENTLYDSCIETLESKRDSYVSFLNKLMIFRASVQMKYVTVKEVYQMLVDKATKDNKLDMIKLNWSLDKTAFTMQMTQVYEGKMKYAADNADKGKEKIAQASVFSRLKPVEIRKLLVESMMEKKDSKLIDLVCFSLKDTLIVFEDDKNFEKNTTPGLQDKKKQMFALVCMPVDPTMVDHTILFLGHSKYNDLGFLDPTCYSVYTPYAMDIKKDEGTITTLYFGHQFLNVFQETPGFYYDSPKKPYSMNLVDESFLFPEKLQDSEVGTKYPKPLDKIIGEVKKIVDTVEEDELSNFINKLYLALDCDLRQKVKIVFGQDQLEKVNPELFNKAQENRATKNQQYLAKRMALYSKEAEEQKASKRQKVDENLKSHVTVSDDEGGYDDNMEDVEGNLDQALTILSQGKHRRVADEEDEDYEPAPKEQIKVQSAKKTTTTTTTTKQLEQQQLQFQASEVPNQAAKTTTAGKNQRQSSTKSRQQQ